MEISSFQMLPMKLAISESFAEDVRIKLAREKDRVWDDKVEDRDRGGFEFRVLVERCRLVEKPNMELVG